VEHARQVLDQHVLQMQQDQLNLRVNQSCGQFRHRQNSSIEERQQQSQRHAENKTEMMMPVQQNLLRQSQPHLPDRLHTGLIEPEESKSVLVPHHKSTLETQARSSISYGYNLSQKQKHIVTEYIAPNDRSTADLVRYKRESSLGLSYKEDASDHSIPH